MDQLGKVLIVEGSAVVRQLLEVLLSPHCAAVLSTKVSGEAKRLITEEEGLSLVLCNVLTPDGTGFDVLSHVQSLGSPKPEVVLLAVHPSSADRQRALEAGALGYLALPFSFRALRELLTKKPGWRRAASRRKAQPLARAALCEDAGDAPLVTWEVRNLSVSGALLKTHAPLAVGATMQLALELGNHVVRVTAEVVRVQEPSWANDSGVAVRFIEVGREERVLLQAFIAEKPS
jgi:CheY-like chemotaxis protein